MIARGKEGGNDVQGQVQACVCSFAAVSMSCACDLRVCHCCVLGDANPI